MGIWGGIKKFSREFVKLDNTNVYTPYAAIALSLALATPVVIIAFSIIITNFFIRGRALDPPTVDLLKYLLGAVTGIVAGAGATIFSKTTMTNVVGSIGTSMPKAPKPDPPIGEKD